MIVGLAPISAYRTLDLPAVGSLTALAMGPLNDPRIEAEVRGALRATGTGVRADRPDREPGGASAGPSRTSLARRSTIRFWRPRSSSAAWVAEQGPWARQFSIWRPEAPARAPGSCRRATSMQTAFLDDWSGDPRQMLRVIREGRAAATRVASARGVDDLGRGRGARLGDHLAARRSAVERPMDRPGTSTGRFDDKLRPAFRRANEPGGWQCVEVPAPGRWTLRLEYEARDVERSGWGSRSSHGPAG